MGTDYKRDTMGSCPIPHYSSWRDMDFRCSLIFWLILSIFDPATGASPPTVNGALGHSVSLLPRIPVGSDVTEVEWRRTSPRTKLAQYSKEDIEYFGSEEYKRRVTLHLGDFSLEISDLRREDAGDYEVTVTVSSGAQTRAIVRLDVSAGTGAPPPTVNGARGHSVSLPPGIPVGPDVHEVVWRQISLRSRRAQYSNGKTEYFGTVEYKRRVTLHPRNFILEIRDLRRKDAGDYEVTVTTGSGAENIMTVRLEVYEPVSGTHITVHNISGTCNLTLTCSVTSGDNTSFRWWRGGEAVGKDSPHHLWEHGETVEVHHTAEVEDVVYRCEARNPVSEGMAQIRLRDVCNITTSGPAETDTVYRDNQWMRKHCADRQPPEGDKRVTTDTLPQGGGELGE
ncbi:uncharacterized protein LOC127580904 isoform X2 [Pristis pectinata]|uniref:uncharacterized protein LOC127580904 isoform X2 n=1 Tax=Pristis pectinata TaxID=685728 RepID=UPI00223E2734|nr:uncharacterized protein LOC127580904 isoform X2 [Pristis pectinata]